MAISDEAPGAVCDEPRLVQGARIGIPARLYSSFLSDLMGSVTDRGAVYLAGTYRSVGKR